MIDSLLNKDTVRVHIAVKDWEDAIRTAGKLLYDTGAVEQRYIDNMVNTVLEMGPYIVLIKGVAMAHTRPDNGAKKIGLSLITLKDPVEFGHEQNDPVYMVFALSAIDNSSHIELISEMAKIFEDESRIEKLYECETKEELLDYIYKITSADITK